MFSHNDYEFYLNLLTPTWSITDIRGRVQWDVGEHLPKAVFDGLRRYIWEDEPNGEIVALIDSVYEDGLIDRLSGHQRAIFSALLYTIKWGGGGVWNGTTVMSPGLYADLILYLGWLEAHRLYGESLKGASNETQDE